ncbi:MAG: hypothetical protein ACT4PN_12840 [Nitrospiraceae bacterium]
MRATINTPTGDFAVIDVVRRRHQMYVRDAKELAAFLSGYRLCAGPGFKLEIDGFANYIVGRLGNGDPRVVWTDLLAALAPSRECEVSLLLQYLDEYRSTPRTDICEARLTYDQRRFDFDRRNAIESIDFPQPVLMAPHILKAVSIEGVGIFAFFLDRKGDKYFELCLSSLERLYAWAQECFQLSPSDWSALPLPVSGEAPNQWGQ